MRERYQADMAALLEKYGIDASECGEPGSRNGATDGSGNMMGGMGAGQGAHRTANGANL